MVYLWNHPLPYYCVLHVYLYVYSGAFDHPCDPWSNCFPCHFRFPCPAKSSMLLSTGHPSTDYNFHTTLNTRAGPSGLWLKLTRKRSLNPLLVLEDQPYCIKILVSMTTALPGPNFRLGTRFLEIRNQIQSSSCISEHTAGKLVKCFCFLFFFFNHINCTDEGVVRYSHIQVCTLGFSHTQTPFRTGSGVWVRD